MRMELFLNSNPPVPKLGSSQDLIMREFLSKRKVADNHRLMAEVAASLGNAESVKEQLKKHTNAVWYKDLFGDRDKRLHDYYTKHVRHLTPTLHRRADGSIEARGLQ